MHQYTVAILLIQKSYSQLLLLADISPRFLAGLAECHTPDGNPWTKSPAFLFLKRASILVAWVQCYAHAINVRRGGALYTCSMLLAENSPFPVQPNDWGCYKLHYVCRPRRPLQEFGRIHPTRAAPSCRPGGAKRQRGALHLERERADHAINLLLALALYSTSGILKS